MPHRPIDRGVTVVGLTGFAGATGLWHLSHFRRILPATPALYFGSGESGWHAWGTPGSLGGAPTSGVVVSDLIDLSDFPTARFRVALRWWQFANFRTPAGVDQPTIEVRVGGSTVETLHKVDVTGVAAGGVGTLTGFKLAELTEAAGTQFRLRFGFDSVNAPSACEGWFFQSVKLLIRRR